MIIAIMIDVRCIILITLTLNVSCKERDIVETRDSIVLLSSSEVVISPSGGNAKIEFICSGNWIASSDTKNDSFWCEISPWSGSTVKPLIEVRAGPNNSGVQRKVIVKIMCGIAREEVLIIQDSEGLLTGIDVPQYLDSEW